MHPELRAGLEAEGAVVFTTTGATLSEQPNLKVEFTEMSLRERLILWEAPGRVMDVAVFPNPADLIVIGSIGFHLLVQNEEIKKDAKDLRRRFNGFPNAESLAVVFPRASEIAEVVTQYRQQTGQPLLGGILSSSLLSTDIVFGRGKLNTVFIGASNGEDPYDINFSALSYDIAHPENGAMRFIVAKDLRE